MPQPEFRKLSDSRSVCDRRWAAHRWGVTLPAASRIADRYDLQRFATKTRGGVAHFFLVEDVERIRRIRLQAEPEAFVLADSGAEFVALADLKER